MMLRTEDLPRMTSLLPGNDAIYLKATKLMRKVSSKVYKHLYYMTPMFDVYVRAIMDL